MPAAGPPREIGCGIRSFDTGAQYLIAIKEWAPAPA
jgi:hypothetical protein